MKSITTDRVAIENALRTSNVSHYTTPLTYFVVTVIYDQSVVVGGGTVRPNIRVEQHTIILREVCGEISSADITDMFRAANCPSIVGCRSEMNSTWFVTFATEEAARSALFSIRSSRLGGAPVRARLKTESTIRSYYQYVYLPSLSCS